MSRERRERRLFAAVAEWRRRSIELTGRLRTAARHDDAWLWRIHLRILRFLLVRYEHASPEPVEPADADLVGSPDSTVDGPINLSEGRPARTREEIRAVLIRIAVANGGASSARPLVRAA